ncbi:cytochrome oxidase putative small subunit CydP [Methylocystis iwaonis]|uniref:cytochrome oxidase putative small subunit CydP n=1 Tax=Methylocystis iwaonis TaxID=2885079 RepID=UPI0024911A5F|nr:cytochrome oxidase putative small subunit CydP [Methylocystis iwaonis]
MPRSTLRRELTLAIIVKVAAIFLLYFLFFSPAHRIHVTPADMAAALLEKPQPR